MALVIDFKHFLKQLNIFSKAVEVDFFFCCCYFLDYCQRALIIRCAWLLFLTSFEQIQVLASLNLGWQRCGCKIWGVVQFSVRVGARWDISQPFFPHWRAVLPTAATLPLGNVNLKWAAAVAEEIIITALLSARRSVNTITHP